VSGAARVALVTGATDGIGKAAAKSLARRGWEVVVSGRSRARCEGAVAEITDVVPGAKASAVVGDLSCMADVRDVAAAFRATHDRLDALVLNANAITQDHTLTPDGFEANLAVGYLGRALLAWELEGALARSERSQVISVVGLNLERIDFDDPSTARGFSSMKALGRWQWAAQVFAREQNRRGLAATNVYMPGLVRTKILANEPQPMRLVVRIANAIVGVPVDRGGEELATVIERVRDEGLRDEYFARTKKKPRRELGDRPGDGERLWALTERMLAPFRAKA
jgi:NAD(P)-dependent dehydrogenase (short-subunit alcohol dehydrogenase family)